MDVDRVTRVFRGALNSFMSRRKSPLSTQMFTDLFNRFPVSVETEEEEVVVCQNRRGNANAALPPRFRRSCV